MTKEISCAIAFNFHDSSVAFAEDNKINLVLEAERIFRRKKMRCSAEEMEGLVKRGLSMIDKSPDDVSYWALETLRNPWLSLEDTFPNFPTWKEVEFLGKKRRAFIINHHLSHASAYLFSPFIEALIVSCDGGGDRGERFTVYEGKGDSLKKVDPGFEDFITAKPYDLISTYLYGKPMCEGKLMALASYGEPKESYIKTLEALIPTLNTIYYDASDILLSHLFPGLKGEASRANKNACDLAASLHRAFVQHRIKDIERLSKKYDKPNLVLVGGACLNLEVNTQVWRRNLSRSEPYIPSCCDDTGQALGALSYLLNEVHGKRPEVNLPYLGLGLDRFDFSEKDLDTLVQDLLDDKILLIHNSKSEIGPRALGNRSFIARPDSLELKDNLSVGIKKREPYRPVAPIVPEDKVFDYFIGVNSSPFMLHQYEVRDSKKDLIKGVIHYDGTARVQTITKESNPFMYSLIERFGERTGTYVLINTSLNLKGEPLSNTLGDTLSISEKTCHPHRLIYNGRILR